MKLKIKQDILELSGNKLIASDNSGSIGEKELDQVKISYDRVSYYLFRVAYMETLAAGGIPEAILLNNFNGDAAWSKLIEGLEKGFEELEIPKLKIDGSTESNFTLKESATALSIISQKTATDYCDWQESVKKDYDIAVIGKPLVGQEVIIHEDRLPSLKNYQFLANHDQVLAIIPVGSKGITSELKKIDLEISVQFPKELDLKKSAGPATSYIILYKKKFNLILNEMQEHTIFKGNW